jgi:hypothetical protein
MLMPESHLLAQWSSLNGASVVLVVFVCCIPRNPFIGTHAAIAFIPLVLVTVASPKSLLNEHGIVTFAYPRLELLLRNDYVKQHLIS